MASRHACAALVARLAARPEKGTLLAFLGRLATEHCEWLDGDLAVEVFEDDEPTDPSALGYVRPATRLRLLAELGGGQREHVLPPVVVSAPIDELATLAANAAEVLGPLRLERVSPRCMLLTTVEEAPAPTFALSETCLSNRFDVVEVDESWDVN